MSTLQIDTLTTLPSDIFTKHLIFRLIEKKPKTDVFVVLTKLKYPVDSSLHSHHQILGYVKFKAHWRQYIYQTEDAVLDMASSCLIDINDFVTKLNKELHEKRSTDNVSEMKD